MTVGIFVFGGVELDVVVHNRFEGDLGEVFHFEEPLHRKFGLDNDVGTFGVSHLVVIVFDLFEQTGLFKVYGNLPAHVEAVLAYIHAAGFADGAVVVENIDDRQVVFLAQHIVVDIVGGGYFQTAGTEFDVDIVVHDDGHGAAYQRYDDPFAFEVAVARVVGVDTHGRIAQYGFGTGGGHDDVFVGLTLYHVAEVVELAVFFFIDNLFVGEGGERLRVPVYHAHAAVDESLVEKVDKYLDDAAAAGLVHGEGGAVPVA